MKKYKVTYEEYFEAEDAMEAVSKALEDIEDDPAWKFRVSEKGEV